jgi:nucleotide-binding universal stress UspA family protein
MDIKNTQERVSSMYDKLLVAVDRSDVAERVIHAAREMALLSDGEVWLLHVQEKEVMPRAGLYAIESHPEALSTVERAAQELSDAGIKTHYQVRSAIYGYAAHEIVAAAKDCDADVIVMGSRGRGDLAGLMLGSTAHKVIHHTDRPVLVVR